jgi:hypothetical protein
MELDTAEYYKDKLVYIYYTFIKPNGEHDMVKFAKMYEELLCSLTGKSFDIEQNKPILKMLYKLIAQTRDFCYGKGERDITYMMIYKWYKYYPNMGLLALCAMMFSENNIPNEGAFKTHIDTSNVYIPHQNSYGCFKDVKYFCNYVKKYGDKRTPNKNALLCKYAITMLNQRVYDDYMEYCKNGTMPSLAAKWVPRENSKYDWIFEQMAIQWANATNPHILSSLDLEQYEGVDVSFKNLKAVIKCKMMYRKVISQLSKLLDLPETKQCQNNWAEIDPAKITIDAMFRNSNALFNIDNTFEYREPTIIDKDRRQCAYNIKDHIFMTEMSPQFKLEKLRKSYIYQHTFSPMQFVKQAIKLIKCKNIYDSSTNVVQNILYQIGVLNDNWKRFSKKCNTLDFFIPIVDLSLSMDNDAIYNAIGMGCLIAEKSKIGQRVMVMDNVPTWVNLDGCVGNFVEMVETLYSYTSKNTISNILKTFDTIIQSISNTNNDANSEKMDLIFVIFMNQNSFWKYENVSATRLRSSAAQNGGLSHIFSSEANENEIIHPIIIDRFKSAKVNIPHIVYWNCSNATTYIDDELIRPISSITPKSCMVSGTNAELLNHFSFIGWDDQYNNSAIDTLENILSNSRYDMMDNLFEKYFNV